MIKSIIFDFDGVILDTVEVKGDSFVELYKNESKEVKKQIKKYHFANLSVSRYIKINYIGNNFLDFDKKKTNSYYLKKFEQIVKKKIKKSNYIYGIKKFIKDNYKNYLFFISSATPQNELYEIVKYKKIHTFFREVLGSPDNKKKHMKKITKKYKLKKKEVLFIGDTKKDLQTAIQSNINFLGIQNKYENFENLNLKVKNFMNFQKKIKLLF